MLCGFAREDVTVALGGDGADELFAGYDPFRALKWAGLYERLIPKSIHRAIALIAARMPVSHGNMSLDFKIKRTLRGLSYPQKVWCPVWMAPLGPEDWEECFNEPCDVEDIYSEAIQQWDNCTQSDLVDKTLQFYTKLYLQDGILVKVDRASMMHSLEVRSPFLDIELVDFVRTIPSAYKLRHGQTKYLLKKALEPILPAEVLYRNKKGFGVPTGKWFQAHLGDCLTTTKMSGVNLDFLQHKLKSHQNKLGDYREVLWNALVYSKSPVQAL
jgi:asparagine synthase (glutamine-hydrolysing)